MTKIPKIAASVVAGSLFYSVCGVSAWAASASTDAFVAAVRPNADIIDRTSRLALDKSGSLRVRRYAHRQAMEQTIADNSLVAWSQANTMAGAEVALGMPMPLAPVVEASAAPAEASVAAQEVVTGRSVAVDAAAADRPLTVTRARRTEPVVPDFSVLTRLSGLRGAAFDKLYLSVQRVSLAQLAMLYSDYARGGDDPALRALATRELPKINRKLAELRSY